MFSLRKLGRNAPLSKKSGRGLVERESFRATAEMLECRRLLTTITVTGTGDTIANDGLVTLREAITAANTNAASGDAPAGQGGGVVDQIKFNIPGSGVQKINLTSGLTITDKVSIDGYTQPGASRNTLAVGTNANLLVDVQPDPNGFVNDLLTLAAGSDNSSVSGLAFGGGIDRAEALHLQSNGNQITGNYLGLNAAGTTSDSLGAALFIEGNQNVIGTSAVGDRNVITTDSHAITSLGNKTKIQNNYLGINAAGTSVLPSGGIAMDIIGSSAIIGGTAAGQGNVVAGWTDLAVFLDGATHAVMQGNLIGTDASGVNALGNRVGIGVLGGSDNTIGGTTFGAGNVIADSSAAGIAVYNLGSQSNNPLRNAILGNTYFGNTGLNIDLAVNSGADAGDGVTPNDNLDADSGPNDFQNFPVLKAALFNGSTRQTTITGSLNSLAENAYQIEFFDTNGGTTFFVGATSVITNANGNANFNVPIQGFATGSGDTVTATATRIFNGVFAGTSEFSAPVVGQNAPALSIADSSITEGNSGTKNMTFTVSMSGTNPVGASVQFATTDGSALAGEDYVANSGKLVWHAGDTTPKTFTVAINGDTKVEDDEFLFVNLTNPVGATLGDDTASGEILNDDTGVSVSDVTATEGNAGTKTFDFTVSRTGLTTGATSVKFATADGATNPATAGSDYVAKTGTVSWAANDTADKTISITVKGDTTVEKDETFFVRLSGPTGATLIDGQGVGTITNDDAPPTLAVAGTLGEESGSGSRPFNFTVTLTGANPTGASVKFATANGTTNPATAGSDYVATTGTLTWAPGDTTPKTISVLVNGDNAVEKDETFFVNLSGPTGATIATGQAVGTIVNDDATFTISDASITEGNAGTKLMTFTVTHAGVLSSTSNVQFATANGTTNPATAGSDYIAKTGTLSWAAGDATSRTVSITINGDTTVEPNETFFVNLFNPIAASVVDGQGVGTILNDDTAATTVIVDNPAAVLTGKWAAVTTVPGFVGVDYLNDSPSPKGGASAKYNANLPSAGFYQVFARWPAGSNRATNVPIDIQSATNKRTVTVNQQLNSNVFVSLGTYQFNTTGGSVTIRNGGTTGLVIADAVEFVKVVAPTTIIKDNADSTGVTITGVWKPGVATSGFFGPNYLNDGNPTVKGKNSVTFSAGAITAGTYEVFARWISGADKASNARYDIATTTGIQSVIVNQRINGSAFVSLGFFNLAASGASVKLRNDGANGFVIADAVELVKVA